MRDAKLVDIETCGEVMGRLEAFCPVPHYQIQLFTKIFTLSSLQ